ncbi:MAG: DUF1573 domain-containing protein [Planctomycetota bacterium]
MKSSILLLVAACVGVGVGWGSTIVEQVSYEELFLPSEFAAYNQQREGNRRAQPAGTSPKVELVNGRVHDFGTMDRYAKKKHTFLIKNVGNAPLLLDVSRSTCKCTVGELDQDRIPPGETQELEVEWEAKLLGGAPEFEQEVEVNTNDPENPLILLVIKGYVIESLRALPPKLVLGRVSASDTTEAEFRLFGAGANDIEILEATFEKSDTADQYEIAFEPLPQEEVQKEKGVSCGLLAKLTVKPGLPLGPINQTIRIGARVEKEAEVHVPLKGQTVGDIMVASSALFESRKNLLNFGALERTESATAVLQVFITGEHRHETELSVGEVDPAEYLNVEIGPPEALNEGAAVRRQVTIEIPAGMRPINRLSPLGEYGKLGRVVLETTHPTIEQIPIRVRFAVD